MSSVLALDIETFPVSGDPEAADEMLEYKLRSYEGDQKEQMRQKYLFLNPAYAKVLAIGTVYSKEDGTPLIEKSFIGEEADLLSRFSRYLSNFKGVYVHFNGLDFDVPFSLARMAVHGIQPPNQRFCNLIRFRSDPHFDVMQLLCFWRSFGISLREACRMFGIPDPKDILGGKPVTEFLRTASPEETHEYVMGDARAAYFLYKKLSPIIS